MKTLYQFVSHIKTPFIVNRNWQSSYFYYIS